MKIVLLILCICYSVYAEICPDYITQSQCYNTDIYNCAWCIGECVTYDVCNDEYMNELGHSIVCNNVTLSSRQRECMYSFQLYWMTFSLLFLVLTIITIIIYASYIYKWKLRGKIGLWIFFTFTILDAIASLIVVIIGYILHDSNYAVLAISIIGWYVLVFMIISIVIMILFISIVFIGKFLF